MSHDPMDVHVDKSAFWAAYESLQADGVTLAQVRGDIANKIAVAVLAQRTNGGEDRLRELGSDPGARVALVDELRAASPTAFTSVTKAALHAAVGAAARTLIGEN